MVKYIGKIIPIGKNSSTTVSPALPVQQVDGREMNNNENTIIKEGKGSIQFRLPITSTSKQIRKQRR